MINRYGTFGTCDDDLYVFCFLVDGKNQTRDNVPLKGSGTDTTYEVYFLQSKSTKFLEAKIFF
jgi:hypothetical protein